MSAYVEGWTPVPCDAGDLYESPRWVAEREVFQWVDITRCHLLRWSPSTGSVEKRHFPGFGFLPAALPLDGTRQVVASKDALWLYDWDSGDLDLLAQAQLDEDVRFNDGGVSPDGDVYIGSMSIAHRPGAGALYRLRGGSLETVIPQIGISNGIAWRSPAEAYYVDSLRPQVDLVDLRRPLERRRFAAFEQSVEPDGIAVGPDSDLFVALWRGGRIAHISSRGEPMADIIVPATFPTAVALGGPAGELMVVTTAAYSEVGIRPREGDGLVYVTRVRGNDTVGEREGT